MCVYISTMLVCVHAWHSYAYLHVYVGTTFVCVCMCTFKHMDKIYIE